MTFTILGSGGCVCIPKPLCRCRVCTEAREKGYPRARCGCSLYCDDIKAVIDTPEDICTAINNAKLIEINTILYSHCDPDHILGMRVAEQLKLNWLDYYDGIRPSKPLDVYAIPAVMRDLNKIKSKNGSFFEYYERMGLIQRTLLKSPLSFGNYIITPIAVEKKKAVTVFMFTGDRAKVVYAPCDCIPFPDNELLFGADVLIIGNTFIGNKLKDGREIGYKHPLRRELHSVEDVLNLKNKYNFKNVIITHIEEDWGKSYDDYRALEEVFGVKFAYDGMKINV
ncbi:MAG: MBL fold metallo-hydrolase [Eubacteriales bacterium]